MTSLISEGGLALGLHFRDEEAGSEGRPVWGSPCRETSEARGQVSPPGPPLLGRPTPTLTPEPRAAGQEVKGACRKPQEELRLEPALPPPARGPGDLRETRASFRKNWARNPGWGEGKLLP